MSCISWYTIKIFKTIWQPTKQSHFCTINVMRRTEIIQSLKLFILHTFKKSLENLYGNFVEKL